MAAVTRPDTVITRHRPHPGERAIVAALFACAAISVLVTVGIIYVLAEETLTFLGKVNVPDFLFGDEWAPARGGEGGEYGFLPLLNSTVMIGVGSLLVGGPLGIVTAIYLSEYARPRVRNVLKPVLEILAGIPTVVIGFFALQFITPNLLREVFGDRVFIFNAAAGSIGVGLMILPIVASISEDAMRAVPQSLREASYGMGASRRITALRVVVPAALSGIAASLILALSRAVGETMIVAVAAGNTPPDVPTADYFQSIQTITAAIVNTFGGEVSTASLRYNALFALGSALFVLTLAMNLVTNRIVRRFRQEYQ